MLKMKHIAIVAVHPDDETLGAGGTLLKYKNEGVIISWIIVTGISTDFGYSKEHVEKRQKEILEVAKRFQFDNVIEFNFQPIKLDEINFSDLVNAFSNTFNQLKPDTIILPNRSDVHSDHKFSFDAAYCCTKNFRYPFINKIMMCEYISETEFAPAIHENVFIPTIFVDISKFIDDKLEIMKIYESEVMQGNLPRSLSAIRSLNGFRGSRIGVEYSESFALLFQKDL